MKTFRWCFDPDRSRAFKFTFDFIVCGTASVLIIIVLNGVLK